MGAYRTEEGKPLVLECVREAEKRLVADLSRDKEYQTQLGNAAFAKLAAELALGSQASSLASGRVASAQTLSGTGALRLGGELLARQYAGPRRIAVPNPTWAAHHGVFRAAGLEVTTYRYYDAASRGLDYEGLRADLAALPRGTIVLLHACAHNPTGVDPSLEQWKGILETTGSAGLLPFFDMAYQGFASGDLARDAAAVRLFEAAGREFVLAQSFAKNMGLYGERVGALHVVAATQAQIPPVASQLKVIARALYSSPPIHGAAIAQLVLQDPVLLALWKRELKTMADRILRMRKVLYDELQQLKTPGSWQHILDQIGMFSYTGLSKHQVAECLTKKHHVYMTLDGRISMAGLSERTAPHLARAIDDAVRNYVQETKL